MPTADADRHCIRHEDQPHWTRRFDHRQQPLHFQNGQEDDDSLISFIFRIIRKKMMMEVEEGDEGGKGAMRTARRRLRQRKSVELGGLWVVDYDVGSAGSIELRPSSPAGDGSRDQVQMPSHCRR